MLNPTVDITVTPPYQYPPFLKAVKADVQRYYGNYQLRMLIYLFLFDRTFRPIFSLRLCQSSSKLPTWLRPITLGPCRALHFMTQQLAGLDLPWRTQVGIGFRITHGWGLVVNPASVIGQNVTVFHGVTLAQKDDIKIDRRISSYPTIDDEVWIGPHAVIIGGINIGKGSRIGAGSVVTKDVQPYTIVAGNPAAVIKTNTQPDIRFPACIERDPAEESKGMTQLAHK